MNGLSVQGMRVRYGAAQIVTGVNLTVGPAERVGLVGHNGVGKTTTLKAISGAIGREAVEITFNGEPLRQDPNAVAKSGICHVPEGRGIFRSLTVRENLWLGAIATGKRPDRPKLEAILSYFPQLTQLLNRHAGLLSGGEQQMLAVARGLMSSPDLLMVDELSLGLSPRAMGLVLSALADTCRQEGTSVLLVDQNVRALASFCDRMYILSGGVTREADPKRVAATSDWLDAL
jgi:branched-chain amino acid transport system ATP-binding protein